GCDTPQALLEVAVRALERDGLPVVRRSRWWRSSAWPNPAEPPFVNGVVLLNTDMHAPELLVRLHAIESRFGRDRTRVNAPRTLDLDLIAHGQRISAAPALPHPRAADRLFVMGPLAEIAPSWRHPVSGLSAATLAKA